MALRYSRADILNGELWRLITCHFIHLNLYHGVFNIVAMTIIVVALGEVLSVLQWLVVTVALCVLISLGLFFFSVHVASYVGLSGLLHGVFALLVIILFVRESKLYGFLLLAFAIKLVREQLPGFDIYHLNEFIGGAVIVDGHLYGALSGCLLASFFLLRWKKSSAECPT